MQHSSENLEPRRLRQALNTHQESSGKVEASNRQLLEGSGEFKGMCCLQRGGIPVMEASQANFFVITASADRTAQMWSMKSGSLLRTFEGHTDSLWSCCLSPDGTRLFTTSEDGTAKMWELSTGRCLRTFAGEMGQPNWACVTAEYLITAVNDETAKVWRLETGMFVKSLPHQGCVCSVCMAPDGRHLFTADNSVGRKFTVPGFEQVCVFNGRTRPLNRLGLYACCMSHDGKRFFTASFDGSVKMFDAEEGGAPLLSFEGPSEAVSVAVSPAAPVVFCGRGDDADGIVQMFSTETGDLLRTFRAHSRGVSAMCVTSDGRWLLTSSRLPLPH